MRSRASEGDRSGAVRGVCPHARDGVLDGTIAVMPLRSAAVLLASIFACASCGDYPPRRAPQDLMARGEPIAPVEQPAKAGDMGVVSGRLSLIETFAPAGPIGFERVSLYRDGRAVAEASTDARGAFLFVRIKGGGEYELRVTSDRFAGSRRFLLKAGDAANVDLVVRRAGTSQK